MYRNSCLLDRLPTIITWHGNACPVTEICQSGLWNVKHVNGPGVDETDEQIIEEAVNGTLNWLSKHVLGEEEGQAYTTIGFGLGIQSDTK